VNKHSIRDYLGCELSTHASTFKETSYDDENGEYLCQDESTDHVYNFDAYVRKTHDELVLPASPDAIHLGVKHIYFVEFNRFYDHIITEDVSFFVERFKEFRC